MNELGTYGDRLRLAINKRGISPADLSKKTGISKSSLSQYINGSTGAPRNDRSAKIAKALNINQYWLDTGKGLMTQPPNDGTPLSDVNINQVEFWEGNIPLDDDEFEVPYYKDVEFMGGAGSFEQYDEGGRRVKYAITTAIKSGASRKDTFCTTLRGDSMEDLIRDGAMIAIDGSKKEIREGKIYAFTHGGLLRVKYLIPRPHGALTIRSHNPAYEDEELTPEEVINDIELIGWVWNWSSLERW